VGGLKNLGSGKESYNFPAVSCKFPVKEIMGAQNFNFCCQNLSEMGVFSPKYSIVEQKFLNKN